MNNFFTGTFSQPLDLPTDLRHGLGTKGLELWTGTNKCRGEMSRSTSTTAPGSVVILARMFLHSSELASSVTPSFLQIRSNKYGCRPGLIHLCDEFWVSPPAGTDSQVNHDPFEFQACMINILPLIQAGIIVHETSHFFGTVDHAYGQAACRALAISDSEEAGSNADSYEYFSENNPALP